MNIRSILAVVSILAMAILLTGCGPDTAAQLQKTQADLATAEKQASELKAELGKSRVAIDKLTQERDQALHDVKFFANKVNPLEVQNYEKADIIAKLKEEIEKYKNTIEEMKAAPAAPAAPNAPGMPQ
jgi:chromosome segregation ATPase